MSWPTPQDYNEAFQNPRLNFEDPDLQSGTPDVTPLGLPRPITGGFASVYSIRSGSRRWAVRCFLRDFSDHKERYAEIGRHLAAAKLPYTVDFRFLEKGIRVRGQWYPLLKMEWIEGSTFHEVIESNIQNPTALSNLAERWIKMLGALKKHGIAHGDLQHGNVLVANGDFRLIDYDGMFVPAFAGKTSHEVGHRNYQHPARTETDFGPHLDNFSGWAIYLTLVALSVDAGLWRRYGGDQEHVLFQKDDFDQPRFSRLFRSLQHLKDDRIQKYLSLFQSYLGMRLSSIASPADVIGAPPKKRRIPHVPLPTWSLQNQLDLFSAKPKPAPEPLAAAAVAVLEADAPPSALNEILENPPPQLEAAEVEEMPAREAVAFTQSLASERILLAAYTAFVAALIGFAARGFLPGAETFVVVLSGSACAVFCLLGSYLATEETRAKFVLWFHLEFRRNRSDIVSYGVSRLADRVLGLDFKESQRLRSLDERGIQHVRKERDRIAEVKRTLAAWVDELKARRAAIDAAEDEEVRRLLRRMQERHDALLGEGALLANIEADKLGGRDRKKLIQWRQSFDEMAQTGPPQAVSSADRLSIRKRYDRERHSLRRSEYFARTRARTKIAKIRRVRERQHERMNGKRDTVRHDFDRRKQRLQRNIDRGTAWLSQERLVLAQGAAELNRYRDIRFSKYVLRVLGFGRLKKQSSRNSTT